MVKLKPKIIHIYFLYLHGYFVFENTTIHVHIYIYIVYVYSKASNTCLFTISICKVNAISVLALKSVS